jgi:ABC-type iron transport system FetAB ATPase subunit
MLRLEDITIGELRATNLTVAAGECIGLHGTSGSGKTRLLRAIADLEAHGGQAYADGAAQNEVKAHEWRRRVMLLPAESQWWQDRVGQHFDSKTVAFDKLGFEDDVVNWQVGRCSSGEKQRLAILRLLSHHPRVLLLDEPSANLDAANTERVEALIKQYLEQFHAAAIWVSHDLTQLERVASRQFQIIDGQVSQIA